MNIIFCGLPLSGKSTLGRRVAGLIGWNFIDTDTLLEKEYEQQTGQALSCRDIFKKHGEPYFRDLEKQVLESLKPAEQSVIALGGGSLQIPANRTLVKALGRVIYLKTSPATLLKRMEATGIPAYIDRDNPTRSFINLAQQREAFYLKAADQVVETDKFPYDLLVKTLSNAATPARGKLCIPIVGPSLKEAQRQVAQAQQQADLLEFRIDLFDSSATLTEIARLHRSTALPVIFAVRPVSQGGLYSDTEENRLKWIEELATLKPAYIDLEFSVPSAFFTRLSKQHPEIQLIASFHSYTQMPEDPDSLINALKTLPAQLVKVSALASTVSEALQLMLTVRKYRNICATAMGAQGSVSRILAPTFGSAWSYASLSDGEGSAPGQITAETLESIYRTPRLNAGTAILGLIGNPVDGSQGHLIHNKVFDRFGLNAVYVKMAMTAEELPLFFKLARQLNFRGLSVTMPLKEAVLPFLDVVDPFVKKAGACNTILFKDGKLYGYNTDGPGALEALLEATPLHGKRMVIIGAGGAAKAVACEAISRGLETILVNRDGAKAVAAAHKLGCTGYGLDQLPRLAQEGYDIIVNCTPADMPIDPDCLLPGAIAMDIRTRPVETPFLIEAKQRRCTIVPGYKMWIHQALRQLDTWFGSDIDKAEAEKLIQSIWS